MTIANNYDRMTKARAKTEPLVGDISKLIVESLDKIKWTKKTHEYLECTDVYHPDHRSSWSNWVEMHYSGVLNGVPIIFNRRWSSNGNHHRQQWFFSVDGCEWIDLPSDLTGEQVQLCNILVRSHEEGELYLEECIESHFGIPSDMFFADKSKTIRHYESPREGYVNVVATIDKVRLGDRENDVRRLPKPEVHELFYRDFDSAYCDGDLYVDDLTVRLEDLLRYDEAKDAESRIKSLSLLLKTLQDAAK